MSAKRITEYRDIVLPECKDCQGGVLRHIRENEPADGDVQITLKCKNCGKQTRIRAGEWLSEYTEDREALLSAIGSSDEATQRQKMTEKYGKTRLDRDPLIPWVALQSMTDGFERLTERSERLYKRLVRRDARGNGRMEKESIAFYRKEYEGLQAEQMEELVKRRRRRRLITLSVSVLLFLAMLGSFLTLRLVPRSLREPATGVEVELPADSFSLLSRYRVELNASEMGEASSEYAVAAGALREVSEKFVIYDLFLTLDGAETAPEGRVSVTIPLPSDFRKENAAVYYIDPNGTCVELACEVSSVNATVTFETDHFSLYALVEEPYRVTFRSDGVGELSVQSVLWGQKARAPEAPLRQGYTFLGWRSGEEDGLWDFDTRAVTRDTELWAVWEADRYTVTLDPGEGALETRTVTVTYDEPFALPTPTLYGYEFLGWYRGESACADGVWNTEGDVTLRARWEVGTYSLRFNTNCGAAGTETERPLKFDTFYSIVETAERRGYTFTGWYREPECINKVTELTMPGSDHTLYAGWEINTYKLTFVGNGGDLNGTVSYTVEDLPSLETKYLQYPEYNHFLGWFEDEGKTKRFDERELTTDPRNLTLYADWDLCRVFVGVANTPESLTDARVLLDWSGTVGASVAGKDLVLQSSVTEIVMLGNPDTLYTNTSIVLFGFTNYQTVAMTLNNFKYEGCATSQGVSGLYALTTAGGDAVTLALTVRGNSSVETTGIGQAAIHLPYELNLSGDGILTVHGGDGDYSCVNDQHGGAAMRVGTLRVNGAVTVRAVGGDGDDGTDYGQPGANGGDGIVADTLIVSPDGGSLTAIGGNGGDAYNRASNDNEGDGHNGRKGYAGGNGGKGLVVDSIVLNAGVCYATGGKGGAGGAGSEGNGNWFVTKTGGDGGAGGAGGNAIETLSIVIGQANLTAVGGDGGNGGTSGGIKEGQYGSRGSQGEGGSGGTGIVAAERIQGAEATVIEGSGQSGDIGTGTNGG